MYRENKELGIYIHIPFCKQKCYYCDFTSFAGCEPLQERYVDCLKKELQYKLNDVKDSYKITTIYIGGGTPSYIDSKYIKDIMNLIMSEISRINANNNNQSEKRFLHLQSQYRPQLQK